jgi:hypothetical protein
MRIVLFVFFISWVPAVFYVASRFTAAYSAGAVTLLSVAWSVPNYPGPMPSWYNLFFATFGTAALLRYVETTTRRWLFLAGLCAGLSFLAKVTAAYFVAGTLLFFIFREQAITNEENRRRMERARFYSTTIFLGLAVFIVLLSVMIRKVPGVGGLIYFVLPPFALVVLLASREFAGIAGCACLSVWESRSRCLYFWFRMYFRVPSTIWYMDFLQFPQEPSIQPLLRLPILL